MPEGVVQGSNAGLTTAPEGRKHPDGAEKVAEEVEWVADDFHVEEVDAEDVVEKVDDLEP